ncbi:MAG: hypothetical protein GC160_28700 [Acidobacteria bacterium]|nr:hypothetical protein [Acidobacteriota bacterium]
MLRGTPTPPKASGAANAAQPQATAAPARTAETLTALDEDPAEAVLTEPEEPATAAEPEKPSGPPRYATVPESAQWPAGPYRQAPAEFGGEWWYTSPFTGEQPWLSQGVATAAQVALPPGATEEFLSVFGPPPQFVPSGSTLQQSTDMAQWLIDLENFHGTGVPDGFTQDQLDAADAVFESWGLGKPVYYEGRYGWKARFPDSSIPNFEAAPFTAIETPHLVVARFQVKAAQQGQTPLMQHPFVPPQVFGQEPLDV